MSKEGQKLYMFYMYFVDIEKAFDRVLKKSDEVGHEKERFIRNNGSSKELV